MDKNLLQRIASGLVYGLVIFLCTTPYGGVFMSKIFPVRQQYLYFGLIAFLLSAGLWECTRIMRLVGRGYAKYILFFFAAVILYRFGVKFFHGNFIFNFNLSEILGLSLIAIASVTVFRFPGELGTEEGKAIFSLAYVVLPFCFALGLPTFLNTGTRQEMSLEVFMLFVLIWSSDSFAYFAGRLFGRHKMAPRISPKKTWEGFAGGVVLTLVLGFFIERYFPQLRGNWMVVGLLVSVFAPLGDLVESQLKRTFGVKDSGNLIPGHGGVLDRLDSFIICAPVLYLYFVLDNLF